MIFPRIPEYSSHTCFSILSLPIYLNSTARRNNFLKNWHHFTCGYYQSIVYIIFRIDVVFEERIFDILNLMKHPTLMFLFSILPDIFDSLPPSGHRLGMILPRKLKLYNISKLGKPLFQFLSWQKSKFGKCW